VIGYSDADYAGDLDDKSFTNSNLFRLTHGAISWFSKKQTTATLSTAVVKCMALSPAIQKA